MNLNNIKTILIAGALVVAAVVAPRAHALEAPAVSPPPLHFLILPLPPCLLVISLVIQEVVWVTTSLEGRTP